MLKNISLQKRGLIIFVIICIAYLFVTFHRVSPAIMAQDIIADTGISASSMGVLASAFFVTFGLMQLPGGMLADSWGPRKTLPSFFLLAGIGGLLFAFGSDFLVLLTGRALMGIGVSITFVCGLKILSLWFPATMYARLSGIFLGTGGLGLILGSGPLAYLCELVGWRMSMVIEGIITLIIATLLWLLVRDTPKEAGYIPISNAPEFEKKPLCMDTAKAMLPSVKKIFASGKFWLVAIWFCVQFANHMAFGGLWAGTFLMEVHGLSKTAMGNVLLMMGVGMLVGAPFNGWLADVVFRGQKQVMVLSSCVTIGLFAFLCFFGDKVPYQVFYIWFFLLAAFGMGALSAGFAAVRNIFGIESTGTASGLLNAFPSVVVALLQTFSGYILEMYPRTTQGFPAEAYANASIIYIVTAIIALGAALLLKASDINSSQNTQ